MKYINRILAAVMTLAAFAVASCQKESTVAKAVLVSESYLTCPAEEAPDQFIKVYADADWVCDAPEWITVSPASGTGTMDVTLSFADNLRDGAIDNPRKDTIIFRGTTLASYAYLVIQQEGDKYRDLQQKDLTEIAAEPNEAFVYAKESQVVALATDGFVVTDAQTTMFVQSATLPEIGDKVTFYGYVGEINGLKVVTRCEKLQTNSNSAVTYPVENNVTATFDSYTSKAVEYITLDGVYEGGQLKVNDATTNHCLLYNPIESLGLADLNGHKITVKGYHAGTVGSTVYVIVVSVVDNGVDEIIYFSDNFDWVADLANEAGAGDSMGAKGDNNAKNAYTAVEGFAELLASQGYEDLFPTSKTIYLQKNYLKFSKGSNVNGIKLPAVTYGGTTNVVLTFDWGVHVGGGGPDKVNLVIEVEGNGEVVESGFDHTAGDWTWQSQTVHINGVDDNTRILIKPSTFVGEVSSGYYRWYLDNIKIVQGEGAAPSVSKTYFEETWDWVAPWADAYGSGDAVGENDHSAKAPNVYTQKSHLAFDGTGYDNGGAGVEGYTSFLEEFETRGYVDLNPDPQVMYTQKYYMKFGKTNNHTGITLPANEFEGATPVDVQVSFNWCAHMITTEPYTYDKVQMVIVVDGPGTCADSGAAISNAYDTKQTDGQMAWQDFSVRVNGVTKDTRISIRPLNWDKTDKDGAEYKVQRWHLDNIKIETAK